MVHHFDRKLRLYESHKVGKGGGWFKGKKRKILSRSFVKCFKCDVILCHPLAYFWYFIIHLFLSFMRHVIVVSFLSLFYCKMCEGWIGRWNNATILPFYDLRISPRRAFCLFLANKAARIWEQKSKAKWSFKGILKCNFVFLKIILKYFATKRMFYDLFHLLSHKIVIYTIEIKQFPFPDLFFPPFLKF